MIMNNNDRRNINQKIITDTCKFLFTLEEYQRKQIVSILICSMLTEQSNKDAEDIYNKIINLLDEQ